MRVFFFLALLATFLTIVAAWEKEDHEIFDLVSEIEASEGKGTSFYSWLDVSSTASTSQISKAYRKKSMLLHPDKNPGVKGIPERFARLGVIAAILRSPEGRKRYDHFYKNGVPKWRGTGYYYSRWRPGMLEVVIFLVFITSSLQYLVQSLTYKTDIKRIEQVISNAKLAAWGPKRIPVEGKRKVKVPVGSGARVDEDGNSYGGKAIDMVVEGDGSVSILDEHGDLHPLDKDSATPAAIGRTWFISLLKSSFAKVTKRSSPSEVEAPIGDNGDDSSETASDGPGSGTVTPNGDGAPTVLKGGKAATVKAGGKRRKAVRKR